MELETLGIQADSQRKKTASSEQAVFIVEQIHLLILKMQVQVQERIDELWLLENHAKKRADGFVAEHKQIRDKIFVEILTTQERTEELLTEIKPHLKDVSVIKNFIIEEMLETKSLLKEFTRRLSKEMQDFYNKTISWAFYIGCGAALSMMFLSWIVKNFF